MSCKEKKPELWRSIVYLQKEFGVDYTNGIKLKLFIHSQIQETKKEMSKCYSCGKPLSRDCPNCKRLWES